MQKMSPMIWFSNDDALDAAKFYLKTFPGGKLGKVVRYPKGHEEVHGHKAGQVMTVSFKILGQEITGLNGGKTPGFDVNGGISFVVACKDQKEIDGYWKKILKGGGKAQACGWINDKWGVHWQIVPAKMDKIMGGNDKAANERAFNAMMKMVKLDIAELERAARGN